MNVGFQLDSEGAIDELTLITLVPGVTRIDWQAAVWTRPSFNRRAPSSFSLFRVFATNSAKARESPKERDRERSNDQNGATNRSGGTFAEEG
jgi:hypothetical protein